MQQLVGLGELHITFILPEPVAIPAPTSVHPTRSLYPTRCLYLFPACHFLAWIYLHLISRTFYVYRDSLRQPSSPCRDLAESVHLSSSLLVRDVFEIRQRWEKCWQGGKRRDFPSLAE